MRNRCNDGARAATDIRLPSLRRPFHVGAVRERDILHGLGECVVLPPATQRGSAEPDVRDDGIVEFRGGDTPCDARRDAVARVGPDLRRGIQVTHRRVIVGEGDIGRNAGRRIRSLHDARRDEFSHRRAATVAVADIEAVREAGGDAARPVRVDVAERRAASDLAAVERHLAEKPRRVFTPFDRAGDVAVDHPHAQPDDVACEPVVFALLGPVRPRQGVEVGADMAVGNERVVFDGEREARDNGVFVSGGRLDREVAHLCAGRDAFEESRPRPDDVGTSVGIGETHAGDGVPSAVESPPEIA